MSCNVNDHVTSGLISEVAFFALVGFSEKGQTSTRRKKAADSEWEAVRSLPVLHVKVGKRASARQSGLLQAGEAVQERDRLAAQGSSGRSPG